MLSKSHRQLVDNGAPAADNPTLSPPAESTQQEREGIDRKPVTA